MDIFWFVLDQFGRLFSFCVLEAMQKNCVTVVQHMCLIHPRKGPFFFGCRNQHSTKITFPIGAINFTELNEVLLLS